MKVACIDINKTPGGTCLNVGCIPSKTLLNISHRYDQAMNDYVNYGIDCGKVTFDLARIMQYKENVINQLANGIQQLFKKYKIDFIHGKAKFINSDSISVNDKIYHARNFILATGSKVRQLKNFNIDNKAIIDSTKSLSLTKVPQSMAIIGGGYIGLEIGSIWNRLGTKITVIEVGENIALNLDEEIRTNLYTILKQQNFSFELNSEVQKIQQSKSIQKITLYNHQIKQEKFLECEVILSSVGRIPCTQDLNLSVTNVKLNESGQVIVNNEFRTQQDNIFAIGDLIHGPMLAHKAMDEGIAVADILLGKAGTVNYATIPSVVYTYPEAASVGKTEQQLKAESIEYKVGKALFAHNGRAIANDEAQGLVKIYSEKFSDKVLGVHILHAQAGEMIEKCVLALEYEASAEDIARTCVAHPSTSETVRDAAFNIFNQIN